MCCFAKSVLSVTNTQIFARMLGGGMQSLVYQMKFASKEKNAMILPLPVAPGSGEGAVEFVSLEGYDRFFSDLSRGFPRKPRPSGGLFSRAAPTSQLVDSAQIEVHDVGDFIASFVPTMEDFSRLDPQFVIPKESWEKIPGYGDYGFAVFQLEQKSGEPHPMAMKFRTRFEDQVFFPTVHIHDGEVHAREEFDHTLYMQSAEYDAVVDEYDDRDTLDHATGMVRSKRVASAFCKIEKSKGLVDGNRLLHKATMKGMLKNQDVIRSLEPSTRSAGNSRRGWSNNLAAVPAAAAPAAVAAGGVGWFFARRSRLMAENPRSEE
ncbi:MAG: hypothetical protein AAFU85_03275 [Planctomycetota bacterium]